MWDPGLALYSGGKNRRGRGIGLPSRGQGPHLGCPPSRVNSKPATPSLPSMRRGFTTLCSTLRAHTVTQERCYRGSRREAGGKLRVAQFLANLWQEPLRDPLERTLAIVRWPRLKRLAPPVRCSPRNDSGPA